MNRRKLGILILSCLVILFFVGVPKLIRSNSAFIKNKKLVINELNNSENAVNGLIQFSLNISSKDINRIVLGINGIETNIDYVDENLKRIEFLKRSPELIAAENGMLLIASSKERKKYASFYGIFPGEDYLVEFKNKKQPLASLAGESFVYNPKIHVKKRLFKLSPADLNLIKEGKINSISKQELISLDSVKQETDTVIAKLKLNEKLKENIVILYGISKLAANKKSTTTKNDQNIKWIGSYATNFKFTEPSPKASASPTSLLPSPDNTLIPEEGERVDERNPMPAPKKEEDQEQDGDSNVCPDIEQDYKVAISDLTLEFQDIPKTCSDLCTIESNKDGHIYNQRDSLPGRDCGYECKSATPTYMGVDSIPEPLNFHESRCSLTRKCVPKNPDSNIVCEQVSKLLFLDETKCTASYADDILPDCSAPGCQNASDEFHGANGSNFGRPDNYSSCDCKKTTKCNYVPAPSETVTPETPDTSADGGESPPPSSSEVPETDVPEGEDSDKLVCPDKIQPYQVILTDNHIELADVPNDCGTICEGNIPSASGYINGKDVLPDVECEEDVCLKSSPIYEATYSKLRKPSMDELQCRLSRDCAVDPNPLIDEKDRQTCQSLPSKTVVAYEDECTDAFADQHMDHCTQLGCKDAESSNNGASATVAREWSRTTNYCNCRKVTKCSLKPVATPSATSKESLSPSPTSSASASPGSRVNQSPHPSLSGSVSPGPTVGQSPQQTTSIASPAALVTALISEDTNIDTSNLGLEEEESDYSDPMPVINKKTGKPAKYCDEDYFGFTTCTVRTTPPTALQIADGSVHPCNDDLDCGTPRCVVFTKRKQEDQDDNRWISHLDPPYEAGFQIPADSFINNGPNEPRTMEKKVTECRIMAFGKAQGRLECRTTSDCERFKCSGDDCVRVMNSGYINPEVSECTVEKTQSNECKKPSPSPGASPNTSPATGTPSPLNSTTPSPKASASPSNSALPSISTPASPSVSSSPTALPSTVASTTPSASPSTSPSSSKYCLYDPPINQRLEPALIRIASCIKTSNPPPGAKKCETTEDCGRKTCVSSETVASGYSDLSPQHRPGREPTPGTYHCYYTMYGDGIPCTDDASCVRLACNPRAGLALFPQFKSDKDLCEVMAKGYPEQKSNCTKNPNTQTCWNRNQSHTRPTGSTGRSSYNWDYESTMSNAINIDESDWKGFGIGSTNAKNILEVYVDFTCGACKFAIQDYLPKIWGKFAKTGNLRIQFKNYPLGFSDEAVNRAVKAECFARSEKTKWFFSRIFDKSGREQIEALDGISPEDRNVISKCINDSKTKDKITSEYDTAEKKGFNKTPILVLNDKEVLTISEIDNELSN